MDKDIIRIISAIISGATIGGFIARLVNPHIWFIGVIIGGLFAYLSFCWREVIEAIKKSLKETFIVRNPGYFKLMFMGEFSGFLPVILSFGIVFLQFGFLAIVMCGLFFVSFKEAIRNTAIIVGALMILVSTISFLLSGLVSIHNVQIGLNLPNKFRIRRKILLNYQEVKCVHLDVWGIEYEILTQVIQCILNICVCIGRFFRAVFITIHSEKRLICMIDTAIGITIGYWMNHSAIFTLVGAVIGVIIGLLNYYVVSIRWLKLKPA